MKRDIIETSDGDASMYLPLNTSETHSLKGLSTDLCGALKASLTEKRITEDNKIIRKTMRNRKAGKYYETTGD